MSVTLQFRENRLKKLVDAAGGVMASAALKRAEAEMASLQDECREEVDRLIQRLTAAAAAADEAGGQTARRNVYVQAKALAGLAANGGLPDVGKVAYSLCDLTDLYRVSGKWSAEAVGVHLATIAMMRDPATPAEARATLMDGLVTIIRRARQTSGVPEA